MNVQIVNGTESTDGTLNGVGNLIIGYNESRGVIQCPDGLWCGRLTGSHNLIVGSYNNYTSNGGIVVGLFNEISGAFSSVSGGTTNTASGHYSSVSGGNNRTAAGVVDWVAGSLWEDE